MRWVRRRGDAGLNHPRIKNKGAARELVALRRRLEKWRQAKRASGPRGFGASLLASGVTQQAKRRPSRNSPCPCGSGAKVKKCCGYD